MGNSGISGLNGCWAATQGIAGSCHSIQQKLQYWGNIWHTLSKHKASDCRYDIIFSPDGMWGSLVNGVWNGFPRQLQTKVIKLRFYFLT